MLGAALCPTTTERRRARFVVGPAPTPASDSTWRSRARAGISRAAAQRLIDRGLRHRRRRRRRASTTSCAPARRSSWRREPPRPPALDPRSVPYALVYEDEWLLVVDKPAGVVVHPAPGHEHGTLVQGLLEHGIAGGHERRPGIVHRLDSDTSGLLIVARSDEAYRRLVAAMERRDIARVYLALLVRRPAPGRGHDRRAHRPPRARPQAHVAAHHAPARRRVTHFARARRAAPGYTLAARAAGDRAARTRSACTSPRSGTRWPATRSTAGGRRPAGLARQFLHAARLRFPHPEDGRQLSFASPLPPELHALLEGIGLPPDPVV